MRILAVVWVLLVSMFASPLRAETYEWRRTRAWLERAALSLDPAPEGKRIAYVRVVRDEVFVEEEIWPTWFNAFHWLTQEEVVRSELLFARGQRYEGALAEESMRNLRSMGILALVRIVAVKTDDPGAVGVIVHTRDVWSLRLEQEFNITNRVNYLLLRLTERNLFGRNQQVGTDFVLLPTTYSFSQFFYARRLLNSELSFSQSAGLILDRERHRAEGSTWSGSFGMPIYSLDQRYGFVASFGYTTRVARQVRDGRVLGYQPALERPPARRVWRQNLRSLNLAGITRRGSDVKHTIKLGWDMRDLEALPIAETRLDPGLLERFVADVLPRQRREIGPFMSYNLFLPQYEVYTDLGTFAQSEDVRVGPALDVTLRVPARVFGSSTQSVVGGARTNYVLARGGGLLEASVGVSGRLEEGELVDRLLSGVLRGATPLFSGLRVVGRAGLDVRAKDTSKALVALGGSNGLRGYQSQSIVGYGASALVGNLEIRTRPVSWNTLHVGGVLFYDIGAVYERWDALRPQHALGVGLRLLFPQFNRYPFSVDGGVPIDPGFRIVPTIQSGQVVPMTATEDALAE